MFGKDLHHVLVLKMSAKYVLWLSFGLGLMKLNNRFLKIILQSDFIPTHSHISFVI